jgi:hypothetical protein
VNLGGGVLIIFVFFVILFEVELLMTQKKILINSLYEFD